MNPFYCRVLSVLDKRVIELVTDSCVSCIRMVDCHSDSFEQQDESCDSLLPINNIYELVLCGPNCFRSTPKSHYSRHEMRAALSVIVYLLNVRE